MKRLSVCQLFGSYNSAGISRVAVELSLSLRKRMDVTLACRRIDRQVEENLSLVNLNTKNTYEFWKRAHDLVEEYDIIHTHDVYSLPGLLKNKGKAKIVYTEHGIVPLKYSNLRAYPGMLFAHACRYFSKKPDLTIGISDYILEELKKGGFTNVIKIPNGVNLDSFRFKSSSPLAYESGSPMLLKVGLIEKHKAIDYHIDSMPFIVNKHPNASMTFIGAGSALDFYKNEIKRKNLTGCVNFLGFIDDATLPWYYKAADVVLSVDHWHSFGLPILEGMACGKPVIARNSFTMREHILNSDGGILIDGRDPKELALALEKILSNYEFYSSKATAYAEKFDWRIIADQYCSAYERVINGESDEKN